MKVAWIGLGKLGMPCATVLALHGHKVTGYDINETSSATIDVKDSIAEAVADAEVVFVAVPTPHDPEYGGEKPTSDLPVKDFDYTAVKQVLAEADKAMVASTPLVLVSTVLPGTVRSILAPLVKNVSLVYNPYLIAMGSVTWDMINPEMLIIGTEDGSVCEPLRTLYNDVISSNPYVSQGTWEEAESVKIFYNTWISTKLALVNMVQDVAMKVGHTNVDVVTDAFKNAHMRITGPQYMTAGMGDGGACHPRDNIALSSLAIKHDLGYDMFKGIMGAREGQAKNMAKFLVEQAKMLNKDIVIHGKAYKPGVPYVDGSYSLLVGHYINSMGYAVKYVDPYTSDTDPITKKSVVLLAHNPSVTYAYTGRPQESEFYCDIPKGSVVVDPWRKLSKNNKDFTVIHYGDTRDV